MSSVIGVGKEYFPFLLWEREIRNTSRNIFLRKDGSIECLSLTVNGVSFEDLLLLLNTKYPTSGINQFVESPFTLFGPINQFEGGFPAINQT